MTSGAVRGRVWRRPSHMEWGAIALALAMACAACGQIRVDADRDAGTGADLGGDPDGAGADGGVDDLSGVDVASDVTAADAVGSTDGSDTIADAPEVDAAEDADAVAGSDGAGDGAGDSAGDGAGDAVDPDAAEGVDTTAGGGDAAQDAQSDAAIDAGPIPCKGKADCAGAAPHCDLGAGHCAACLVDAHCPGEFARCQAGQCLPPRVCASDAECVGDGGVCGAFGFCVDCHPDAPCPGGATCTLFMCLAPFQSCVTTADCGAATPICGALGQCVGCELALDCPSGEVCVEGICTPPPCSPGAAICLQASSRGLCAADGSGWQSEPCATGQGCEGGACKAWICVPGQLSCAGGVPTACPPNGSGWVLGKACGAGELCIDGACKTAVCQPGTQLCGPDAKVQTCKPDGSAWSLAACPKGEACHNGACKPIVCAAGVAFCVEDGLWLCNGSGTGKTLIKDCQKAGNHCADGDCTALPCQPGAALCKGQKRLVCAADGQAWGLETCGGASDKCVVSACDPATKICKTGAQKLCDDGNACTDEACAPATGDCVTTPKAAPCDDGDACTKGDVCAEGACKPGPEQVVTFSGAKIPGMVDGAATNARFGQIQAIVALPDGRLVVVDRANHRLRQVGVDGAVTTLAGSGVAGHLDGPAASARFSSPSGVATFAGWLVVGDRNNHRLRRISPALQVATLAGSGVAGDADGKGSAAQLYGPEAVALDAKGQAFVVEPQRHRLRRVASDGTVLTLAGGPTSGNADGPGQVARFAGPAGVALLADGALVVADTGNHRLRRIEADGAVSTLVGAAGAGAVDGPLAAAKLQAPTDVLVVAKGLYVVDAGNRRLRLVTLGSAGAVATILGGAGGNKLVDGPAATAELQNPRGLFATVAGVGFGELDQPCLRRLQPSMVACDDGSPCTTDACDKAKGACSHSPLSAKAPCDDGDACSQGDACDGKGACQGKATLCDDGNPCTADACDPWLGTCVVSPTADACDDGKPCSWGDHCQNGACVGGGGWVSTAVGGVAGAADGVGVAAQLLAPVAIAAPFQAQPMTLPKAPPKVLWIVEQDAHRLRRLDPATMATTTMCGGVSGFVDGAPDKARFASPRGLSACPDGKLVVADANNHRLRRVALDGAGLATHVETRAGDGTAGYLDGPAATARLHTPVDVACDDKGAAYFVELGNLRLRRAGADGFVTTVAGSGKSGHLDGAAGVARFVSPTGLLWRGDHLLVADRNGRRVRRVKVTTGAVDTWLGGGGAQAVDGVGFAASLPQPVMLANAPGGRVWITSADGHIFEARPTAAGPRATRVVGFAGAGNVDGPVASARLASPWGVVALGDDAIIADYGNHRLRRLVLAAPPCASDDAPCVAQEVCDPATGACQAKQTAEGAACAAGPCVQGSCVKGACGDPKPIACDDGKPCTLDACDKATGACAHLVHAGDAACCAAAPYAEAFEDAALALVPSPPSYDLRWLRREQTATLAAHAGKGLLHFGKAGGEAFSALPSYASGSVRLPTFDLPVGAQLTLTLQIQFAVTPLTTASRVVVRLVGGTSVSQLGIVTNTKAGWQATSYDVSAHAGRTVQLELYAQLAPGSTGGGVLIDGVVVASTCKAKPCASVSQCGNGGLGCLQPTCQAGVCAWTSSCCVTAGGCDDANPCTLDSCASSGSCGHAAIAGCCQQATDCKDADACLAAACPAKGGSCQFAATDGCCNQDADCDDGKPCTTDTCALAAGGGGSCTHKDICCKAIVDCDDGIACTTDACTNGFCAWQWKADKGCCIPTQGDWGFEAQDAVNGWQRFNCSTASGLPAGCQAVPWQAPTKGWQVWLATPTPHAGKGVLYYGDPATKSFAWGASAGAAISPSLKVQPGKSTLELFVRWDTEGGTNYDRLLLYLWVDGARVLTTPSTAPTWGAFWTKGVSASAAGAWTKVQLDVSGHVGKSVAVEAYFNTLDAAGNSGLGVQIDEVRLVSTCGL